MWKSLMEARKGAGEYPNHPALQKSEFPCPFRIQSVRVENAEKSFYPSGRQIVCRLFTAAERSAEGNWPRRPEERERAKGFWA